MRKLIISIFLAVATVAMAQKINRQAVVTRNNPHVTKQDVLSALTVGNGHFATTVDVTGLQSFPKDYEQGVPLCAMSDWGWHSFPNDSKLKPEDTQKTMNLGHGRSEVYAVEYKTEGRNKEATEYFRVNPHRLNLGNVGFVFYDKDKQLTLNDIKDVDQTLDLYNGVITSKFSVLGNKVKVTTGARPDNSTLVFRAQTGMFKKGSAKICMTLPYVTGKHADAASDWNSDDNHKSRIFYKSSNSIVLSHEIDSVIYYIRMSWIGQAKIENTKPHTYVLSPNTDDFCVKVEYTLQPKKISNTFAFLAEIKNINKFWNDWWEQGAIVDFSDCTDSRAKELERRTVLSQYLTYINCANDTPPQETGLTYNSWFGRPHLEMTWWHMVDFSLWNRPQVMEKILEWYNDVAYPYAKEIAQRQNFKGIRWMKMTDPWVGESPSNVGSFLTWQQPHYIYMAEEMYRHNPSKETVEKYAKYVEETAMFMADFALSCENPDEKGKGVIKLHGQTAAQESMSKDFSYNHPFEQVYWVYGLTTAQKWLERQGKERNAEWDDIIKRMGGLPMHDGIYTAGEPTMPFADAPTGTAEFDPFNYGGDSGKKQLSKEEFYLKCRSDHPAVLGACGMLPYYGQYDKDKMQKTLDWVMDNWNWDTTWGWDYGMTAMCAARLGDGENAIKALLIDKGKNTYLVSGHNYQEPKRLRLYLPGNGALLDAVAMMCAGWDGCPDVKNPGFPQNGKWNVKWEGLRKMQ